MSESKVEEVVKVVEPIEVVEPTEMETRAMEMGWKPKDAWVADGGEETEHRSAREFVDRGELYKSLHSLKRELRQEREARVALQGHHTKVYETAYLKAKDDLKLQRRNAMRNDDLEAVEAIEEQIEQVDREHQSVRQSAQIVEKANLGPNPEFVTWIEKNQWYESNEELREFADAQGIMYVNKNPGAAPATVLKHVEAKVKNHFKDQFQPRRAAIDPVSAPRRNAKGSDDFELTEMEQTVMTSLVKAGVMTAAEYKADIKKMRGV